MGFLTELTGTETGTASDGRFVRLYNPVSGEYEWKDNKGDWKAFNPSGDQTNWMYDTEGNRVLGYTPEGYEERGGFNPELEGWQAGYQPEPYNVPDRNGMGDDGGQRAGRAVTPPTTVQPGSGGGSGIGDPFTPGSGAPTTPIEWGSGGGVNGVDSGPDIGEVDFFDPQGFGNSTNEDFYAQQSAAQRTQQLRNAMREQVARERAKNQSAATQQDPWAWAGGEDQFAATASAGNTAEPGSELDWVMNPNYQWTPGETTNAELLQMYGQLPALDGMNLQGWVNSQGDQSQWGTYDPNKNQSNPFLNGNPYIEKLFQNMWLSEAPAEPGTPSVPYGYASPISPGGQS